MGWRTENALEEAYEDELRRHGYRVWSLPTEVAIMGACFAIFIALLLVWRFAFR